MAVAHGKERFMDLLATTQSYFKLDIKLTFKTLIHSLQCVISVPSCLVLCFYPVLLRKMAVAHGKERFMDLPATTATYFKLDIMVTA
jgi:hypothetical protein